MSQQSNEDAEATQFAFELLMPPQFVKKEIDKMGHRFDICEDKPISELAKIFGVPRSIMAIRLGQLKARNEL